MINLPPYVHILFGGLLLAAISGCAPYKMKISVTPAHLPSTPKLSERAVLVLDQDLRSYEYEIPPGGDKLIFPFGPPLEEYARQVAGQVFQEVRVAPSFEQAVLLEKSNDLILIPHALQAEQARAFRGIFRTDIDFMLAVEWVVKNRAGQTTIWRKSISASASVTGGTPAAALRRYPILMQELFDDLSSKTYREFHQAPELRVGRP